MTADDQHGPDLAIERSAGGWWIRLPLRREEVTVEKRTVFAERLIIQRQRVADVEHVQASVQREELRVERSRAGTHQDPEAPDRRAPGDRDSRESGHVALWGRSVDVPHSDAPAAPPDDPYHGEATRPERRRDRESTQPFRPPPPSHDTLAGTSLDQDPLG